MTRTTVQEVEVPMRIVRLPEVLARTGFVAEHDLRAGGRGELPQAGRLDRGRGG